MGKMTKLSYDHRSNVSLVTHLKTMQDYAADLEDCGNKLDDAHFKSLLCSSIRHSAFEHMTDGFLSSAILPSAMITELTHKANRMSQVVPSNRNINNQKTNNSDGDEESDAEEDNKKSKWWVEPKVWRKMSSEARSDHLSKKRAYYDGLKGNRVPDSNYIQSNQMTAIMQLLAMSEAERTQLCSQANTLQQLLSSSQQNNTATIPTPAVPNNNGEPVPASANVGNILTQLLQASTATNNNAPPSRLFTAQTCVVQTNMNANKCIVKNMDIPARQPLGLKYFLDFSDMEPSEQGLTNFDFDDSSEDDWEPLLTPTTFMDHVVSVNNVVTINDSAKPVDWQEPDGSVDEPPFTIGSDLTKVYGEDNNGDVSRVSPVFDLTVDGAVIPCSVLHPAYIQPLHANDGKVDGEHFLMPKESTGTTIQSHGENGAKDYTIPCIVPESLIGYEFIHKIDENGFRAKVVKYFPDQKKHMMSLGDVNMASIVSYNEMIDAVNRKVENENDEHDALWLLNPDKKNCSVKIKWLNGQHTWEPPWQMDEDDPATRVKHAKNNDTLDLPRCKRFELDKENDNTLWQGALKGNNPADIQTKRLPGCDICRHMKPWLHWVDRSSSTQDHGESMGSVKNQELPVL